MGHGFRVVVSVEGDGARVVHDAVGAMDVEVGCLELGRAGQI
jgi:hypothetical protein